MAAGKMFLAAKAGRRRTYRKRASGFKKAVSSIAKKVVMRQAETKTGATTWSAGIGSSGALYQVNGGGILSSIVQGDTQANRDGDTIKSLGVKIRGSLTIDPSVITGNRELCGLRVMLVSGKRPLTSGDFPTFRGQVDPEVITVISDRYYKLTSTNWGVFMNQYVKFNRLVRYNGLVAIKNDLYFYIVPAPFGTGLSTTTGYGINVDIQPYFKDI